MYIPRGLPQFADKKALIISSGFQDARFYFARNGEITELRSFRVRDPVYSDREGFFARRGKALYVSGSVYEDKKLEVKKKFLKELLKNVKEVHAKKDVEEIYLIASSRIITELKAHLPVPFRKMIRRSMKGNFVHLEVKDVLKRIKKEDDRAADRAAKRHERVFAKKEAKKIMKRSEHARSVTGGKR